MAFLLVWDKGSCAGSFPVIFISMHICITTPSGSLPLILFFIVAAAFKYIIILFFYCCDGWAHCGIYMVLTMYQICHRWIHPLYHSPSSPHNSCSTLNRNHFCIYILVYTFFAPYSPSFFLFPTLPTSTGAGLIPPSCSLIL
jgi:hypothetical protein